MNAVYTGKTVRSFDIGGFRDTYLGRQVVSRPEGRERGWGQLGVCGALRAPLAGSGAEPQPKSNLVPFSLKIWRQVATISIIFNAMQTTNFKVKKYLGRKCLPLPLIKSAYVLWEHVPYLSALESVRNEALYKCTFTLTFTLSMNIIIPREKIAERIHFTVLHWMQGGLAARKVSVSLSVW